MKSNENNKNWLNVCLSDIILELESGKRPKGGVQDIKEGIPSIGAEHLNNQGGFSFRKIKYVPEAFAQNMYRGILKLNDIVIVKDGATTGKTSFVGKDFPYKFAVTNEHVFICRLLNYIHPRWVFYKLFSESGKKEIMLDFRGAAQGGISSNFINKVRIPLSPLPEQYAIVGKIEELFSELDKGIEALKAARQQLKIYRQSVLKYAFEGKLTEEWRKKNKSKLQSAEKFLEQIKIEREKYYKQKLEDYSSGKIKTKPRPLKEITSFTKSELTVLPNLPEGWAWGKVGNISLEMCLGKMLDKQKNEGESHQYLRNINVRWGNFDLSDLYEMKFKEDENIRYGLNYDDLIICEGGEPGRCAIWKLKDSNIRFQKALHRVRFSQSVYNYFIYNFITFSSKNGHLESCFTGTTIKHFTGEGLENFAVPICNIIEQRQIVSEIENRFSVVDKLEEIILESLNKSEVMRHSILKKAFEGKLLSDQELSETRKDPNWESAEKLLERIKKEKQSIINKNKIKKLAN